MNNTINKNAHYFCQMEAFYVVAPFGLGITSGKTSWVECEISEHRYKLSDGYKISLKPLDSRFAGRDFYISDFELLLKEGFILEKTKDNQHVEFVSWLEELTPTVYIENSGYIVV